MQRIYGTNAMVLVSFKNIMLGQKDQERNLIFHFNFSFTSCRKMDLATTRTPNGLGLLNPTNIFKGEPPLKRHAL